MHKAMTMLIFVAAQSLSACTSVADVQNSVALETFRSEKPPKDIADCIMPQAIGAAPTFTVHRTQTADATHITADLGSKSMAAIYDLTIRREGQGSSIEMRTMHDIWGGHPSESDELITIAKSCAGI